MLAARTAGAMAAAVLISAGMRATMMQQRNLQGRKVLRVDLFRGCRLFSGLGQPAGRTYLLQQMLRGSLLRAQRLHRVDGSASPCGKGHGDGQIAQQMIVLENHAHTIYCSKSAAACPHVSQMVRGVR